MRSAAVSSAAWLALAVLASGCVEEVGLGTHTALSRTPAVTCVPHEGVVMLRELARPIHGRVQRDPPGYGLRLEARLEAPGLPPQQVFPGEQVQIGAQRFRVDIEATLRDGRLRDAQICLTRQ